MGAVKAWSACGILLQPLFGARSSCKSTVLPVPDLTLHGLTAQGWWEGMSMQVCPFHHLVLRSMASQFPVPRNSCRAGTGAGRLPLL